MKYVFIYFKENMIPGSARPREDEIVIQIDPRYEEVHFYDMRSLDPNTIFRCFHNERFGELMELLEKWDREGINSTITRRYQDASVWDKWRQRVFFEDGDVHWQVLIGHDDGSCSVHVDLSLFFPKELRRIYELAKGMNPIK